jgi:hypothetical protein
MTGAVFMLASLVNISRRFSKSESKSAAGAQQVAAHIISEQSPPVLA